MLRKIFLILLISSTSTFVGQEILGRFENSLKKSSSNIKDVIPIVNENNGESAIIIADAKNVYGYKLDKSFNVKEKLSSQEKLRKYKLLIGNSVDEKGDYLIYLANKSKKSFLCVDFSFSSGTSSHKEFKLKDRNEVLLQTLSKNNQFYIFSYHSLKDDFYIYTFDNEGNPLRNQINLNTLRFVDKKGKRTSFKKLIASYNKNDQLKKFNENDPQSLEAVSTQRKMYVRNNSVIFTMDKHPLFTQVLSINLDTFKPETKQFKKPFFNDIKKSKKTNSYINGDYIFLTATTKEKYELQIVDYKTAEIIKTYKVFKEDPIEFKNTPIIQEGGVYDNYRELEKTKKFLRKISQGNLGIAVQKVNGIYTFTLGGVVPQVRGGGMMMPMIGFGVPVASFGNVTVFFNPAQFAYNSYTNTKSTRIECLFDERFNHLKGEVLENAFDKMQDHNSSVQSAETVFKYKDFYIKGTYSSRSKGYTLRKYTN